MIWACLAPLRGASRETLLDLGHREGLALSEVRLTLGVQDVLLLTNSSQLPQVFGQLRVLPGHVFRLPFEQAGDADFACSSAFAGQLRVRVVAPPDPGWGRLRWRLDGLANTLRTLPRIAPFHS